MNPGTGSTIRSRTQQGPEVIVDFNDFAQQLRPAATKARRNLLFDAGMAEDCGHQTQHDFMREWLPLKAEYLSRLYDREAGPAPGERCSVAGCGEDIRWRCLNCIGAPHLCSGCCKHLHERTPFHRIQKWVNNDYFSAAWLHDVGVVIHLGHNGAPCTGTAGEAPDTSLAAANEDDDGSIWESDDEEDITLEREDWMYGWKGMRRTILASQGAMLLTFPCR